jgi:3'-phosphoadenosine 5'-phosphosulfate sulfotransferase (PAPS reductase)/FAD synthetase
MTTRVLYAAWAGNYWKWKGRTLSDLFPETLPIIDPLADAARILREAIEMHKPSSIWVGYSGGTDSETALGVAKNLPGFRGILHLHTTIRIPEVGEWVHERAKQEGIPLKEYTAPVPYDDIVMQYGFPGPAQHTTMYARLKQRGIRRFLQEHKTSPRDRVMLVTGVRKSESKIRMGTVQEIQREGCLVWGAPLTNWTDDHKNDYMAANGLKPNPISKQMCISGECMCGAMAGPGELAEVETASPVFYKRLTRLIDRVKAAGLWHKWGEAPPTPPDPRQETMKLHMCHSCAKRRDAA